MSTNLTDCRYDAVSRTIVRHNLAAEPGAQPGAEPGPGPVCCAGTADLPVAEEAAIRETIGLAVERLYDVGVAGTIACSTRNRLAAARVLIVVAGMEGALPSVVGGLPPPRSSPCRRASATAPASRASRAPGDAEQLRLRRRGDEHRQRVRGGGVAARILDRPTS